MIKRIAAVLVCLLGSTSAVLLLCKDSCPENEVYATSGTGPCEPTCWYRDGIDGCAYSGCICRQGFIRDPNTYRCIPVDKCPLQFPLFCPLNEQWTTCFGNKACQTACYTLNESFDCGCTPGCACKPGYVRCSVFGKCIPKEGCSVCPDGYMKNQITHKCDLYCLFSLLV